MAQKVVLELVDDLDGGRADETVKFALDGAEYDIDLSSENAARLRAVFENILPRARRVGGRRVRGTGGSGKVVTGNGLDPEAVREYARRNGIRVSARGRLSKELIAKYQADGSPDVGTVKTDGATSSAATTRPKNAAAPAKRAPAKRTRKR